MQMVVKSHTLTLHLLAAASAVSRAQHFTQHATPTAALELQVVIMGGCLGVGNTGAGAAGQVEQAGCALLHGAPPCPAAHAMQRQQANM